MSTAPTYDEAVDALVANFRRSDDLAMLSIHAGLQHFAVEHGFTHLLNMIADLHEQLAERAAADRDERIAKLRGLN